MNWWQLLGPVILQIVQAILNRKQSGKAMATAEPNDHAQMDRWATELEGHVKANAAAPGAAAATDGGLVAQVQQLIAALKAHDWLQVMAVVQQILFGGTGAQPAGATAPKP